MAKSRIHIFRDLNVYPKNARWAWCAENERQKLAVFTLWEDEEVDGSWVLYNNKWIVKSKHGFNDQERVLRKALKNKFTILGIMMIAQDVKAETRKIKSIREDYLIKLKLEENNGSIIGKKIGVISFYEYFTKQNKKLNNDGLLDLESFPIGNDKPDRALTSSYVFKRDQKIRSAVLRRANGLCEYCGKPSFELNNGQFFLEAHHIIKLAAEGKDTLDNVIALCPNHHREAHFGKNANELENKFIDIIKKVV